ncbi:unnamed protein product [Leuciscus chuanchicus]
MITVLAMGWNNRKVESLHKTLAERFVKTTQRAEMEAADLESLKQELNISMEDADRRDQLTRVRVETETREGRVRVETETKESRVRVETETRESRVRVETETREFLSEDGPRELTEEGHRGLYCCILHKRHILQQKLAASPAPVAVSTHTLPSSHWRKMLKRRRKEVPASDASNPRPKSILLYPHIHTL